MIRRGPILGAAAHGRFGTPAFVCFRRWGGQGFPAARGYWRGRTGLGTPTWRVGAGSAGWRVVGWHYEIVGVSVSRTPGWARMGFVRRAPEDAEVTQLLFEI